MEKTTETKPKHCFLVFSSRYWGRGKTIKEAAQNCRKSGGQTKDRAVVRMVLNDDAAEMEVVGYMVYYTVYKPGSHEFRIGDGFKLRDLLKLED